MSRDTDERPFTAPILVGGSFVHPSIFAPLALVLPWAAAEKDGDLDPDSATGRVVIALAVLGVVGSLLAFCVRLLRRRWVEVSLSGFVVRTLLGRRTVADEDVLGLARAIEPRSTYCVARVELEIAGQGPLRLDYQFSDEDGDPLERLWKRLVRALARRALERLDQGYALAGDGWEVRYGRLHLLDAGEDTAFDLRAVREVRTVEGEAHFFVGAEALPRVRLPLGGHNVRVLVRLAREPAQDGPASVEDARPSHPAEEDGLGRVRCQRVQPPRRPRAAWLLFFGPPPLAMLLLLAADLLFPSRGAGPDGTEVVLVVVAGLLLVASCAGLVWLVHPRPRWTLWVHRHGLRLEEDGVSVRLPFDEVGGLVWGTRVVFTPSDRQGRTPIVFHADPNDPELAWARDRVALHQAERLMERLARGEPVDWTPTLRFLPDALEHRPGRFLRRGGPRAVRYEDVSYRLTGGTCELSLPYGVARERTNAPNFHAGLALLTMVQGRIRAEAQASMDRARAILEGPDTPPPEEEEGPPDERIRGR